LVNRNWKVQVTHVYGLASLKVYTCYIVIGIPLPPKLWQTRKTYPKRSNKETGIGRVSWRRGGGGGGGRGESFLINSLSLCQWKYK
jgi:hypothetical protein